MKTFNVSRTVSVLANIGVIVSIAFLAISVRQNNALLTVQARANTLSARIHTNELILESSALPRMIFVKFRAGEPLEPDETIRLTALHQYQLLMMQWNFEDYTALGLDPLANVGRFRLMFEGDSLTPGLAQTWKTWKQTAPKDFVKFIEDNVHVR
jgi:hypothetical protein